MFSLLQFFATEPYACDPSSMPKYPPSKEIDAKRRDEEARRFELSLSPYLYLHWSYLSCSGEDSILLLPGQHIGRENELHHCCCTWDIIFIIHPVHSASAS